jgi:hypothetical protein
VKLKSIYDFIAYSKIKIKIIKKNKDQMSRGDIEDVVLKF